MAIREGFANLLENNLRAIFFVQFDALVADSKIPLLFNEQGSTRATEEFQGLGGMSDWEEYQGTLEYDDFDQLYKTTLTHQTFAKGFKVEMELVEDDQYGVINQRPATLALSAMRTREKHAASIFNHAFSSSYTGGDGVSLCNDSHPLAPTHSGDTHDNAGSSALTYDAVVATRRLMRAYPDDRGELVMVQPDTLVVPSDLDETAWAIWATANKVDVADYHANFVGTWLKQVVVWDYLDDANNWFLVDSQLAKLHLLWLNRVPLNFMLDPTSDFTMEYRFRGRTRYSYGWSDWRWVYGHEV